MVLASALLHAIWSATIKGTRSPLAFLGVQAGFGLGLGLLALLSFRLQEIPASVWGILAGASLAHGLYSYAMSRAFERADLSQVYPIIRSTPAFLPLVAVPLLGEQLSWAGALGIAVVVAGIWLVHGDPRRGLRASLAPGMGAAWITLAMTVAYSLLDKEAMARLGRAPWSSPLPRSLVWFLLISAGSAAVLLPLARRQLPPGEMRACLRREGGLALAALAASLVGYGLILQAFQTAPASYVVAVRQLSVLFAVAIAALFLAERPTRPRTLGAAATVAGVALIAWAG